MTTKTYVLNLPLCVQSTQTKDTPVWSVIVMIKKTNSIPSASSSAVKNECPHVFNDNYAFIHTWRQNISKGNQIIIQNKSNDRK